MANKPGRQLALDLSCAPQFDRDNFLVSTCNEAALALIEAWPNWPARTVLLLGPPGSGKSHLAAIFAAAAEAAIVEAGRLAETDILALARAKAIVVENIDRLAAADEASLFHLFNLAQEAATFMLMTARGEPSAWGLRTADLLSRLRLCPAVELHVPDEALLEALIVKLFFDRQLIVDAATVGFIALHIERSFDAARGFVDLLDREALARGTPITRPFVREMLQIFASEDRKGDRT